MSEAAVKRQKPLVRLVKKGNRLTIPRVSHRIRTVVENQLSYNRIKHLRGKEAREARRNIEVIPTECFAEVRDPDGVIPVQILTTSGWLPRLYESFRMAGFKVEVLDQTPAEHSGRPQPYFKELPDVTWRHRQEECVTKICKAPEGGLIVCPTGYGKSFMIGQLCRMFPRRRFDITTHSRDVIEMLYEDLSAMLPSVGMIHGGQKKLDKRVMCISGKSLHHADHEADFLFVDEVHEFATNDYLEKVAKYRYARCFGFTANPPGDRSDRADFELEGLFGPVLFTLPYQEAVDHGAVVPIRVMWLDVILDINPAADTSTDTAKKRHGIWRNKARNESIAFISDYWRQEGKQVLIMVETVEHAVFLKALLPEFELVYAEDGLSDSDRAMYTRWGLIDNDLPDMDIRRRMLLKKQFETGELQAAIATTVWSRGVNFKGLQVLVRADAGGSAIPDRQLPGRLSRISPDKPYGILVDFHDQFDTGFKGRAGRRKRRYKEMGWEQVESGRKREGTRYHQDSLYVG